MNNNFLLVFFLALRARKNTSIVIFLFAAVAIIFVSGCQVLFATAEPLPTYTPTVTITPTKTIQWFPSTSTPTPGAQRPVLAPTVDQRPALGEVAVRDSFSDASLWQTFDTTGGSARIARGALSLAAPELFASLVSLRRGVVPDDFYLEITSSTSLCRGKDMYGVLFRSDGGASHYRLIVSCDGYLRVERWRPGEAAVVQDWTISGQIPAAGPQALRLGIWMAGSDMRIFINDVFQFAARDPLLVGQQVGVFLRSTGANATSVTFSDLTIRRLQGYVPSPVPSPTSDWTNTPTRAPVLTLTPARP